MCFVAFVSNCVIGVMCFGVIVNKVNTVYERTHCECIGICVCFFGEDGMQWAERNHGLSIIRPNEHTHTHARTHIESLQ